MEQRCWAEIGRGEFVCESLNPRDQLGIGIATPLQAMAVRVAARALADRFGSRRLLLTGIPLYALSVSALALLDASRFVIYALFAMAGILGALHNTVPYAKTISKWFDRERGLALGVAMAGIGLGIAAVPQLTNALIEASGWRLGYVGLGAIIVLCAFVPVLLFVREPSLGELRQHAHGGAIPQLSGLTFAEAIAEWRFWAIGGGFFLAVISTNGTLAHVIAMLTDRGVPVEQATTALSSAGVGVIIGRLICGWCLDRFAGPYVALIFFALPAAGVALLAANLTIVDGYIGATLCGAGLGAHVGMLAFFSSRYFGLKAYGRIYGTLFGVFLMGNGTGTYLAGLSYTAWGSYRPALVGFTTELLLIPALFLALGKYPYAARKSIQRDTSQGQTEEAVVGTSV